SWLKVFIAISSLAPQRVHGVGPAGPAGGRIRGRERDEDEQEKAGREDRRVGRLDAVEDRLDRPAEGVGRGQPHGRADYEVAPDLQEDEAPDGGGRGAERDPHPDFAPALRDAEGEDAVDAERGEKGGEQPESGRERGHEPARGERLAD